MARGDHPAGGESRKQQQMSEQRLHGSGLVSIDWLHRHLPRMVYLDCVTAGACSPGQGQSYVARLPYVARLRMRARTALRWHNVARQRHLEARQGAAKLVGASVGRRNGA